MNIGDKWKDWTVESLIGSGSFGNVYRVVREEFGYIYESALKVIRIPQNQSDVTTLRYSGMDEESVTEYLKSVVQSIIYEFTIMSQMRGNSNIVSYEDHSVRELENDLGWEICIRMELLTPLYTYIRDHDMTGDDVVRLGIDICRALEMCEQLNIVHRDIKPANIFVSRQGTFKLGDFGVARQMEKTTSGMSKKGTYSYMAPEVYHEHPYDSTVDIYSLGLVMYRFMNDNRAPFIPPYPHKVNYEDTQNANFRRMRGDTLLAPVNASDEFADVILKACAFDPDDRYRTAREMREALESVSSATAAERKPPVAVSTYTEPSASVFTGFKTEENTDNSADDETVGMPVGHITTEPVDEETVGMPVGHITTEPVDEETVGMPVGHITTEPVDEETVGMPIESITPKLHKKKFPVAAVVVAVLVLAGVIVFFALGGEGTSDTSGKEKQSSDDRQMSPEEVAEYYVFELDGKEYSLPCSVSDFTDNGWYIQKEILEHELEAFSWKEEDITVYTDSSMDTEAFVLRHVFNFSNETKTVSDSSASSIRITKNSSCNRLTLKKAGVTVDVSSDRAALKSKKELEKSYGTDGEIYRNLDSDASYHSDWSFSKAIDESYSYIDSTEIYSATRDGYISSLYLNFMGCDAYN